MIIRLSKGKNRSSKGRSTDAKNGRGNSGYSSKMTE